MTHDLVYSWNSILKKSYEKTITEFYAVLNQVLIKNKAPEVMWTHCVLHRSAIVSKNLNAELNIFIKVTKVINYLKK